MDVEQRISVQDSIEAVGTSRQDAEWVELCFWSYGPAGYVARCIHAVTGGAERMLEDPVKFGAMGGISIGRDGAVFSAVVGELELQVITAEEATSKVMELLGGDVMTCGSCGSPCEFKLKQLRSADEPMTVFLDCKKCGWNAKI